MLHVLKYTLSIDCLNLQKYNVNIHINYCFIDKKERQLKKGIKFLVKYNDLTENQPSTLKCCSSKDLNKPGVNSSQSSKRMALMYYFLSL